MLISVYALRDSRQTQSTSYFYVGSAKDSAMRLGQHKRHASEGATKSYYAKMREIGIENVVADELDVAFDESERIDVEEFWWQQLKAVGHPILNGSPKRGYAKIYAEGFSPEHIESMKRAQKGRIVTDDHKNKISKTLTGRKLSEKHKNNISISNVGKTRSIETRQNISKSLLGKPQLKLRGRHRSEETKAKLSESHKGVNVRLSMTPDQILAYDEKLKAGTSRFMTSYWNQIHSIMKELSVDTKIAKQEYKRRKKEV